MQLAEGICCPSKSIWSVQARPRVLDSIIHANTSPSRVHRKKDIVYYHEYIERQRLADWPWFIFPFLVVVIYVADRGRVEYGDRYWDGDMEGVVIELRVDVERSSECEV